MVTIQTVRSNNAALKDLGPGLVAVFVGGTSGIGLSTARAFVKNTTAPRVYLVGRNQEEATKITQEFDKINPESKTTFVKADLSLLRNVDKACSEIQAREPKVNLLFMTAGYFTTKGREETAEGLDRKFSLHYYARWRFAQNLLPQLTAAGTSTPLSRVVSVLDPNIRTGLVLDDLSLKTHFTLGNCAAHACAFNDFAVETMAAANPNTAFVHAFPGLVNTGLARTFGPVLRVGVGILMTVLKPFMVPLPESGERHLYAATSQTYPPKAKAGEGAALGSDGVKGSGAYWLSWNGERMENERLKGYRAQALGKTVWAHTQEVFDKIRGTEGGKY
ncbi:short-chain dehydrogenase/reductase [Mytilinidion resinicola]|uniref:Short-chain dehydrogenase/reductase n=1 Tax=Mytilinidion resinicola TaxID=574789 RepID=A0A6A6Z9J5_9PEZI|nr:short-chain dehydrogenase/reductase [Mytilinidion resinicola]KAF2817478.1 short-chain dehydrogenase/reductase [Mytilinidion resinicola]